ncbi:helicase-exonuclease AddAB subunit AddA [Feifania hominis]|uniref:DNA 3'-5' helicase n=1 Tax=Feifania hominis TaxID=2763660 RepID=A0A926DBR1_9FIRM|nr:helicase-exonuclease AddAB subunit AddA [Feifania hominis]MBC8535306.1 helicase-exonuclease AddAB subunit AddA [Feifania hominis]
MSELRFTDEQRRAISEPSDSVKVSAAAGSGKTAVLVERVIEKIEAGGDIDRFLIVTFTNAAADDVRAKIGRALRGKLAKSPNAHLRRQLILLSRAPIDTIDGFCLKLLRANFQKLGLSPEFRIGDPNETGILKEELYGELLDDWYENFSACEPFSHAVEFFARTRNDDAFLEVVKAVREGILTFPDREGFLRWTLDTLAGCAEMPVLETPYGRELARHAGEVLDYLLALCRHGICEIRGDDRLERAYLPAFEDDERAILELRSLLECGDYDGVHDRLAGFKAVSLRALRGYEDTALADRLKESRAGVKKELGKLRELFSPTAEQFAGDCLALRRVFEIVFAMAVDFERRFESRKNERGILDFADVERYAYRLLVEDYDAHSGSLTPTQDARQTAQRYDAVFIDEYQDTNELQDAIFRALSRGGESLFFVGDVKQSIYRFRQAEPELFLRRQARRVLRLTGNFRSRRSVVDAVNFLFERLMSPELGDVNYDEGEKLRFLADYDPAQDTPVEVDVLLPDGEDSERAEREFRFAARRIRHMVETGELVRDRVSGRMRPVRYRDIVILSRNLKNTAALFEDILREEEIPYYSDVPSVFFEREEISTILSLLRTIDNPLQDVHLIATLRSALFAMTEDELALIRAAHREGPFYDALCAAGDEKSAAFLRKLGDYRLLAASLPIDQLLAYIYEDTGYLSVAGAMRNGALRRANLQLLYHYACAFEQTSFKGLFQFIHYIDRILQTGGEYESARAFSENSDVVRLMTVHKSKGLEFPVVVLCGLTKRFNKMDLRENFMLHRKLGAGAKLRDTEDLIEFDTLPRAAVKLRREAESLSEELRTLYVALTRAQEKLVLVVSCADERELMRCAFIPQENGRILPFYLRSRGSYAEWILAALSLHRDGQPLRELTGFTPAALDEQGRFAVRLIRPQDEPVPEHSPAPPDAPLDWALLEEIRERLDFIYPAAELRRVPSKISVSDLRSLAQTGERTLDFARPKFLTQTTALTPAERGTAMHKFMQFADLENLVRSRDVAGELERLVGCEFLTAAEAGAVETQRVERFLESSLGRRLAVSPRVLREMRFNIARPAGEIEQYAADAAGDPGAVIVVQGVLDCAFLEGDGYVLFDFKTDRVTDDGSALAACYRPQLELYEQALREITGMPVTERYLYSFELGREIPV